jgi:carboxypeptidase PM20D1
VVHAGRHEKANQMVILAIAIAGVTVFCLAVLFVNTFRYPSKQIQVETIKPVTVDIESATARLSRAIQIPTVSHEDPRKIDVNQFRTFHRFLESTYPEVHHTLDRIVINDLSLLYKWQGSEQDMKPILLLAHQDVVPVDRETANKWTHDAFSGKIADGCVWGRGALDDKGSLIAIMEAVELLLKSNFTPRRSIFLAFGHDEEIGGRQGAARIADYLMEKNIGVAFALDEGMTILDEDLSPAKRHDRHDRLVRKGLCHLKNYSQVGRRTLFHAAR